MEPWLTEHVPTSGRLAVDVGAHIGEWALPLSERFDAVHAFEPNRVCAELIPARPNLVVWPVAVGALHGEVHLHLYANDAHTSAFGDDTLDTEPRGEPVGTLVIEQVTLDTFYLARVDFVKIDVEGLEVDVLRGASQVLAQRPKLLIEIHSASNREACRDLLDGFTVTDVPHPYLPVGAGHSWLVAT